MSIKRISRRRVAAPVTEYVDEEPLATRLGMKEDSRVGSNDDTRAGGPDNTRAGGNVETKAGTDTETKYSMQEDLRAEPAGGRDSPT